MPPRRDCALAELGPAAGALRRTDGGTDLTRCTTLLADAERAAHPWTAGASSLAHALAAEAGGGLSALELRTFVNGEPRQVGYVRDQIHDIPAQIAHLTAAFTLEPGDVIFTGTPSGVGAGHTPPKWLKSGDRVRVEIDCLGFTENEIVREPGETVSS